MPIEQDPTVEQETTPANVQTVSDVELETLRKHKGHGHHGHHGHDGDDNCYDGDHYGDEPDPVTPEAKHESIEQLAYRIWEQHKGDGRDVEDWLAAEAMINEGMLDLAAIE